MNGLSHFASQNTQRGADGVVLPSERSAYHAAIVECSRRREAASQRVTIGGRKVARFLRIGDRDDGTLRCIACGQIDDMPWHKPELCYGIAGMEARTDGASVSAGMEPLQGRNEQKNQHTQGGGRG